MKYNNDLQYVRAAVFNAGYIDHNIIALYMITDNSKYKAFQDRQICNKEIKIDLKQVKVDLE